MFDGDTPVILAGDCHLAKRPGMWGREEIGGDDEHSFKQISEMCLRNKYNLMLLGDTINNPTITPRPLAIAKKHLDPLVKAELSIGYIQGQHELVIMTDSNNVPWLSLLDGPVYMHEKKFKFLGMSAFALDYFPEPFACLQMTKVPQDVEVLFIHATVDAVMNIGYQLEAALIPSSVRYVFAGDFHQCVQVRQRRENPVIYRP